MSTLVPARNAFGSIFSICSGKSSVGTFAELASIVSITPPSFSRGSIDVTSYGDVATADGYEQVISGGPIRTGNVGISAIYLTTETAEVTTIPTLFDAGAVNGWKIEIAGTSSNTVWFGNGIIVSYDQMTLPQDGAIGFNMQMKVVGLPTLAESTV